MLPKRNRLKRKKDIERVLKEGRAFKEDFLVLKFIKNDLKDWRFAFIVSEKVSKKATIRNKIRRRLSELVRLKMANISFGLDAILIALPGFQEKDFWEMEEILNKLFQRAKIIQ